MVDASLYHLFYLVIVTILSLISCRKYFTDSLYGQQNGVKSIIVVLFFAFFIGFRPISGKYFGDTSGYAYGYGLKEGHPFKFNIDTTNILFDNYFSWIASNQLGVTFFFVSMALMYFVFAFVAIRRLFPHDFYVVFLLFLGAFSTYAYGVNGLKAGVAASIFILALSFRDRLSVCIPLILVSYGFHHSMMLPACAFAITLFFNKKPKLFFILWLASLACSLLHVSFFQTFFAGITDEGGANYLLNDTMENMIEMHGFRLDFVLYSSAPVLFNYYAIFKKKVEMSKMYLTLVNVYVICNSIWMLCMFASYTNRIAYLSWQLYPFVLVYPILNCNWGENRNQTFSKVMLLHLGFTLCMFVVNSF